MRMIDRIRIDKGMKAPHLLKAADVVQHPDQPGQIDVSFIQIQAPCNPVRQVCHPVGMPDLEGNLGIFRVIMGRIGRKGLPHLVAVYGK